MRVVCRYAYKLRMCTRMSVYVRVYMFIYVSMRLCVAYVCTAIEMSACIRVRESVLEKQLKND